MCSEKRLARGRPWCAPIFISVIADLMENDDHIPMNWLYVSMGHALIVWWRRGDKKGGEKRGQSKRRGHETRERERRGEKRR